METQPPTTATAPLEAGMHPIPIIQHAYRRLDTRLSPAIADDYRLEWTHDPIEDGALRASARVERVPERARLHMLLHSLLFRAPRSETQ